ncbi:MAG: methionyl-tRNA formyltransferase [Cyanobacteria bacterium P01_A01_bin.105]
MKVVFFGTPQFAVPSLERLMDDPSFDVAAVVTQPDRRRGRGGKINPSPVKAAALPLGCPIWQPSRIKKDPDTLQALANLNADAFVVVAYGQILSQAILDMPRLGCVNAHGSLLPEYRGAAPIQWSLYHGEAKTGITTMKMDIGMDTGPMLEKAVVPIGLLDNAWTLAASLATLSADLLVNTLRQLDGQRMRPVPQNDSQATYAPLIQKADYSLDWQRPALALHNQIRGFYPNCTTTFRQQPLKISATLPLGDPSSTLRPAAMPADFASLVEQYTQLANLAAAPGTVAAVFKNYGPAIAPGEGHLLLREVKPAGKQAQSGWDFANGSRLTEGEVLGKDEG